MNAPQTTREKVVALIKKASTEVKIGRKDLAVNTLTDGTIKIMKETFAKKKKTTATTPEPRVDALQERKDPVVPTQEVSWEVFNRQEELKLGQPEQVAQVAQRGPTSELPGPA
jgi:hypothetical protein